MPKNCVYKVKDSTRIIGHIILTLLTYLALIDNHMDTISHKIALNRIIIALAVITWQVRVQMIPTLRLSFPR